MRSQLERIVRESGKPEDVRVSHDRLGGVAVQWAAVGFRTRRLFERFGVVNTPVDSCR
jgi:hypothetical protein